MLRFLPLLLLPGILSVSSLPAASPPNIVLLMGDDHGWEETGYNGHPHVKTPVLDEIAGTGLRLDRFYSQHPSCSPTRGSFMTGRHPNRYGTFAPGWSMRPEEITIPMILRKAGYACGHFGKWHLGAVKAASPVSPGAMGFDEYVSHDNFFELNPSLSRNGGPPEKFEGEGSQVIVDEAMRFIDKTAKAGKPFFMVIWFGSPHEPYSGLSADLALYDDVPAKYQDKKVRLTSNETGEQVQRPLGDVLRERYAEITAMDRAIGTLRKHLTATGLRQDTLLFYCGDNGTSPDASLASPYRGVKGQVYEGGVRVPGLIEWPARIKAPRRSDVRATTSDLLPTLCAIANQPLPERPLDGMDLTPVIEGTMTRRPDSSPIFFWNFDTKHITAHQPPLEPYIDPKLQSGTTPLVKKSAGLDTRNFNNFRQPAVTDADFLGARSIIQGNHKLVVTEGNKRDAKPKLELFDLESDPSEKTNIVDRHAGIADQLQSELRKWQDSVLRSLTGADYR